VGTKLRLIGSLGKAVLAGCLPNKPAFIALSCSAPLDPTPTDMLTVQITLPHSKAEIGLKWQVSEISALAELLKALAT